MANDKPAATPKPGGGVSRTSGIASNSEGRPQPTPKPSSGTNVTRSGDGGSKKK